VLELLARSNRGLSLDALSRSLELPRSSTHCLLLTLSRRGYLVRNEHTHRYMFGLRLFDLANVALSGLLIRQVSVPFLRELVQDTHLTAHLGVLEGMNAVLIEKVEPHGIVRLATWVGKQMDVHCTALGKALVAYLDEEGLDALIRKRGLPRHNENTITSVGKLKADLAEVRRLGYAVDEEEDEVGFCCVGTPILDASGRATASISVAGPTRQVAAENLRALTGKLRNCAERIFEEMRCRVKGEFIH
jgi:DNA-binding IclR family transcriptional regulator